MVQPIGVSSPSCGPKGGGQGPQVSGFPSGLSSATMAHTYLLAQLRSFQKVIHRRASPLDLRGGVAILLV